MTSLPCSARRSSTATTPTTSRWSAGRRSLPPGSGRRVGRRVHPRRARHLRRRVLPVAVDGGHGRRHGSVALPEVPDGPVVRRSRTASSCGSTTPAAAGVHRVLHRTSLSRPAFPPPGSFTFARELFPGEGEGSRMGRESWAGWFGASGSEADAEDRVDGARHQSPVPSASSHSPASVRSAHVSTAATAARVSRSSATAARTAATVVTASAPWLTESASRQRSSRATATSSRSGVVPLGAVVLGEQHEPDRHRVDPVGPQLRHEHEVALGLASSSRPRTRPWPGT